MPTGKKTNKTQTEVSKIGIKQLQLQIKKMTAIEAGKALDLIVSTRGRFWERKAEVILKSLGSEAKRYKAGKKIHGKNFLSLLNRTEPNYLENLQPLLLGMKGKEVTHLLLAANLQQLGILQSSSLKDALHPQLTHVAEEMMSEERKLTKSLQTLKEEVNLFHPSQATEKILKNLFNSLEKSKKLAEKQTDLLDRCLAIAWFAGDTQQIDLLNELKEYYRNDLRVGIGHPSENQVPASGLYKLLESKIAEPFKTLADDAPASEALAALGILTYGDLAELGIISRVPKSQKNRLLLCEGLSESDPLATRTGKALRKKGLFTVANFIAKNICSSLMLKNKTKSRQKKIETI